MAVFGLALVGCGTEAEPTTSTATTVAQPTTSSPPETTTVPEADAGPQPLPPNRFLDAGEYESTVFEPRVLFNFEDDPLLFSDQSVRLIELMNRRGDRGPLASTAPRRAIAFHNVWLRLTADEIVEELRAVEQLELETVTETEIAGYPSLVLDGSTPALLLLWVHLPTDDSYWIEEDMQVRFFIVDTPVGSLLINVEAHGELWDDFLPTAEEIINGISLPDL